MNRRKILEEIGHLKAIKVSQNIFRTVLIDKDIVELRQLCEHVTKKLQKVFENQVSEEDFKKAAPISSGFQTTVID